MSTRRRDTTEGKASKSRRPVTAKTDPADHPDPLNLCEPSFDEAGLLRWGSHKY